MREIFCTFLQAKAEGLAKQPYPGELGQKIFDNISKQAWQKWLEQQTILINENKLSLIEEESRKFLKTKMTQFLFDTKKHLST